MNTHSTYLDRFVPYQIEDRRMYAHYYLKNGAVEQQIEKNGCLFSTIYTHKQIQRIYTINADAEG